MRELIRDLLTDTYRAAAYLADLVRPAPGALYPPGWTPWPMPVFA